MSSRPSNGGDGLSNLDTADAKSTMVGGGHSVHMLYVNGSPGPSCFDDGSSSLVSQNYSFDALGDVVFNGDGGNGPGEVGGGNKSTTFDARKKLQKDVDGALAAALKSDKMLAKYLGARFSLTKSDAPHAMKF